MNKKLIEKYEKQTWYEIKMSRYTFLGLDLIL